MVWTSGQRARERGERESRLETLRARAGETTRNFANETSCERRLQTDGRGRQIPAGVRHEPQRTDLNELMNDTIAAQSYG
ncbi:unnamed protein product [Lampetra fluviatilis]